MFSIIIKFDNVSLKDTQYKIMYETIKYDKKYKVNQHKGLIPYIYIH